MNFKSAASMFMVKLFSTISFCGFLILLCVADVPAGSTWKFVLTIVVVLFTTFLAVMFHDHRIIFRHIFAVDCVISLFVGAMFRLNSKKYIFVYKTFDKVNSLNEFYNLMLCRYDSVMYN